MERLSHRSAVHLAPPYQDMHNHYADMPRTILRRLRKFVNLPTSDDVAVLAGQIGKLLTTIGSRSGGGLGFQITEVAISVPHLPALYYDDLTDACEHVGIKHLPLCKEFIPFMREILATFAGYWFRLCKHFEEVEKCREEEKDTKERKVFIVGYSRRALTTAERK
jgi:hypothetical protein